MTPKLDKKMRRDVVVVVVVVEGSGERKEKKLKKKRKGQGVVLNAGLQETRELINHADVWASCERFQFSES